MMMKGSSSTFLCALVGLAVLLCVVNEAQGLKCYQHKYSEEKKSYVDEPTVCTEKEGCTPVCYKSEKQQTGKDGLKYSSKDCICKERAQGGADCYELGPNGMVCNCYTELCNGGGHGEDGGGAKTTTPKGGDGGSKGGATTTTPIMAFSTLLSASALAIVTATLF